MDTACVKLKFADGSMFSLHRCGERGRKKIYHQSELNYLIYNDPLGCADLILNGAPEEYLKNVTDYTSLD